MSAVTGDELRQRHTAQPAGMKTPPSDLQTPPTSEDESSLKQAGGKRPATAAGKGGKRSSDGIPGSDDVLPDDYVMRTLAREQALPPIKWRNVLSELQWVSTIVLTTTPLLAIYGMFTTSLTLKTAIWSIIYYFISGLGITAGYHRLWAHRAYSATPVLQYALACMGTSAVEGSIHWWARGHRAHHRYTDTDLDPYGAHHGLLWSHLGWMIVKPRRKPGVADISDLRRNPVIKFQHKFYIPLILFFGFILPTIVAGFGWGDWRGGFFYAAICRLVFVHHSTFCVNSLAHWLGEASFDNKHTPRDHFLTALVTVGEGYHNFHHQFPMDYRNATIWYQYDPTKWFISAMKMVGLAYDLKQFPDNEVKMGRLTMDLQKAHDKAQALKWPKKISELPVVSWDEFAEESKTRDLIVVQGIVHDVSSFITEHPGGIHLLKARVGKDASTAFNGGVYEHSRAAHNLLATMRVGVLDGGYQLAYQTLQKIKAEKEVAAVDADSSSDAGSGTGTGSDSKTQTQTPALTRSTSEDSASNAEASGARTPNDNAINYVIPGEAYTVIKRVDLTANEVAARHGNKVGKLSWK